WCEDGRKLYFIDDGSVIEVDIQTTPRLRVGVPRRLFSVRPLGTIGAYPGFDVSPDGQRFLTVQSEPEAAIQRVIVALDFQLRRCQRSLVNADVEPGMAGGRSVRARG